MFLACEQSKVISRSSKIFSCVNDSKCLQIELAESAEKHESAENLVVLISPIVLLYTLGH